MVQIPRLLLFLEFSRFSRINVSSFVVSPQDHFQRIFFFNNFHQFCEGATPRVSSYGHARSKTNSPYRSSCFYHRTCQSIPLAISLIVQTQALQ